MIDFVNGTIKLAVFSFFVFLVFAACTNPHNKKPEQGETTQFEFALPESGIKNYKADIGNGHNYTVYSPPPELGFFNRFIFKLTHSYNDEEFEKAMKEDMLPDVEGKLHDSAVSLTVDPETELYPYMLIELKSGRGKLEEYDSFKGTLSIVPDEDFYGKPVNTIKTKMNFYFFNEKEELLGKYTIDSHKTKPFEFNLKNSKKLYIVAETDYKELFIGAILSPRLVKN